MLKRPQRLLESTREHEVVTLAEGESPDEAYKLWLTRFTAVPLLCKAHRQTKLVLNQKKSGFGPVYEQFGYSGSVPTPKPREFNFSAVFDCPACYCAFARCPVEFHETSFETFDTSTPERAATLAKAREFAVQVNERGCGFCVFVGPPGPGKTRLACNTIRELNDRDSLYVRQAELTAALRSTYRDQPVEYDLHGEPLEPKHPLKITQSVRFLVLDEIGCTALANDERLLLDELLKHRYEKFKPTLLISNLPLIGQADSPGLKELLGDALTDRIQVATGNGKFIVQFSGKSFRRTIGEAYLSGQPEIRSLFY